MDGHNQPCAKCADLRQEIDDIRSVLGASDRTVDVRDAAQDMVNELDETRVAMAEVIRLRALLGEATRRLALAQGTLSIIEFHPGTSGDTAQYMKDKAGEANDKDFAAQEGVILRQLTWKDYKRAGKET
jgi:hypothetical protein